MFTKIADFTAQISKNPESLVDVIQEYNKKISKSHLNAFITTTPDVALQQAKEISAKIKNGFSSPIMGLPLGIKDLYCTQGIRTTTASKMLENFIPGYESTVTERLFAGGSICLGKTNMDEFAMGSSGKHSYFGATISPIKMNGSNADLVPGGSSSGSAAAVAGGLCLAATGSDTGGSIRQPAALCGIVGFKPSYGSVSRYGMIAYSSSFDQAGFLTNSVEDSALLFAQVSGLDGKDSTLLDFPKISTNLNQNVQGKVIGIPKEFLLDGIHPEIKKAWDDARKEFEKAGATVKEVSLPNAMNSIKVYYFVSTAEASSNFARYDGIKFGHKTAIECKTIEEMISRSRSEGFGIEVQNRILIGTRNLLSDSYKENYERILKLKTIIKHEFANVFKECDVILCPTTPNLAPEMNQTQSQVEEYINDILTVPVNIAGLPGISVPFGKASCGRPIGMQLISKEFQDEKLLNIASFLEKSAK